VGHSDRDIQLSPREEQLIQLASQGLTDTAIALRLGISEATVGTYWGRVRIKIGPYNRTELVTIYLRKQQEDALQALREEKDRLLAQIKAPTPTAAPANEILENAPDAILLVSEDGTLTHGNRMAHELFGYAPGKLAGLPLTALIPERLRHRHQHHRQDYVSDPHRRAMGEHLETPALHRDGSEFFIRASLSAMNGPEGLVVICALRRASL